MIKTRILAAVSCMAVLCTSVSAAAQTKYSDGAFNYVIDDIQAPVSVTQNEEMEAMASDNSTGIEITTDSVTVAQGDNLLFDESDLIMPENTGYYDMNGLIRLTDANGTWTVHYYNVSLSAMLNNGKAALTLYLGRGIPTGTYSAQVELLSRYDNFSITGDFSVTVIESTTAAIGIKPSDGETTMYYNQYTSFTTTTDDYLYTGILSCCNSSSKNVYIYDYSYMDFESGITPGNYDVSVYSTSYDSFSLTCAMNFADYPTKTVNHGIMELDSNSAHNGIITLPEPVSANGGASFYIENTETGKTTTVYSNLVYDNSGNVSAVQINNINSSAESGSYSMYFLLDDTIYGPVSITVPDYGLDSVYYTTKSNSTQLGYSLNGSDILTDKGGFSVYTMVTDKNGSVVAEKTYTNVYTYENTYNDKAHITVYDWETPQVADGSYVLYSELRFTDGEVMALAERHIYIGDYALVSYMNYLNAAEGDTEVAVEVNFDYFVENPDEFSLTVTDGNGDVIGTSEKSYYNAEYGFSSVNSSIKYIVSFDCPLAYDAEYNNNYYDIQLSYNGTGTLIGQTDSQVQITEDPFVVSSRQDSETDYSLVVRNLAAGVYDIYDDYYAEEAVGTLTVAADKTAKLVSDYGLSYQFYIKTEQNGNVRTHYMNVNTNGNWMDTSTMLSSVTPGYVAKGKSSLPDFSFTISAVNFITVSEITSVQLVCDNKVAATASNLSYDGWSSMSSGISTVWESMFDCDFNSINTSLITLNSVVFRVNTIYGTLDYTLPVLGDDEGMVSPRVSVTNTVNIQAKVGDRNFSRVASTKNVKFKVYGTNITSGNVYLQEYNPDTRQYTDVEIIPLDTDTRTFTNSYSYTGIITSVLEAGKAYRIKCGSSSSAFATTDKEMIISTYDNNFMVSSNSVTEYMRLLNANDVPLNLSAYIDIDGTKTNVPLELIRNYNNGNCQISFNFSNIPDFTTGTLVMCNNGADVSVLNASDFRRTSVITSTWESVDDNNKPCITIEGANLGGKQLQLKVWEYRSYLYDKVFDSTPTKVLNITIPANISDSYNVLVSSLGLGKGTFTYAFFENGSMVGYSGTICTTMGAISDGGGTTGGEKPVPTATLTKKNISGGKATVAVTNTSDVAIESGKLFVAAYDGSGKLIFTDMTTLSLDGNESSGDITLDTASNATSYKVMLWDSNMVPLLGVN